MDSTKAAFSTPGYERIGQRSFPVTAPGAFTGDYRPARPADMTPAEMSWRLRDDRTLTGRAKLVWLMLRSRGEDCRPSLATLAADCSMARGTVRKAIAELTASGWLKVASATRINGSRDVNVYFVTCPGADAMTAGPQAQNRTSAGGSPRDPHQDEGVTTRPGGGHHATGGGSPGDPGVGHHVTPQKKKTEEENRRRKNNPTAGSQRSPAAEGPGPIPLWPAAVPDPVAEEPGDSGVIDAEIISEDDGPPRTAQTIVAAWIDHCRVTPPKRVIGHVAKQIKTLLDEGIDWDYVNRGVAEWHRKGLSSPALIANVVHEVMNHPGGSGGSGRRLDRLEQAAAVAMANRVNGQPSEALRAFARLAGFQDVPARTAVGS